MSDGQLVQTALDNGFSGGLGLLNKGLKGIEGLVRAENAVLYGVAGIGLGATLATIAVVAGGFVFSVFIPLGVLLGGVSGVIISNRRSPTDPEDTFKRLTIQRADEVARINAQRALLTAPEDAASRAVLGQQIDALLLMDIPTLQARYKILHSGEVLRAETIRLPPPNTANPAPDQS